MINKKIDQNFLYKRNLLQQIRGFYYAVRFKSISEAARAMNLTQSTVTLQIQSLERDLDLKLFKRDSKPLTLTKKGEDFYAIACPLMHEFESIVEKFLNKEEQEEEKSINIAVHHIAISYLMPSIIAAFKKTNPETKIIIRNIAPSEAIKRLKEDQIDLAFYPNLAREPEIKQLEMVSCDPVLIVNKNHPWAKKRISSLKDLKNFDLIRIDKSLITLPLFEAAVEEYGIAGSVEFENGNWEILKHFVKQDDFAAIVSTICIDKNDDNLVAKNLVKFFPKMNYCVAIKSGQLTKPIVQNLIEAIRGVATKARSNK